MSKSFTEGCHRERTLQETLNVIRPFMARAGITRVADVTGLDYPQIPTVMVTRPNGRSLSVTQGKGPTLDAARVSGIMEAIEHDHAEAPQVPLLLCRLGALTRKTCSIARLPAFPRRFGPLTGSTRLLWAEAASLHSGEPLLVPYEMVHLDLTLPLPEGTGNFPLSSNGLASGNSLAEATVHALCELIERDGRTLFFLSSRPRRDQRRIDLGSVTDPSCLGVIEKLRRAGLDVAAWDLTTDVNVATLLAGVIEREDNPFRRVPLAYGSGTHLDRNVALLRALTEAAQTRLTNIVGARDDTLPTFLDHARTSQRQEAYRAEVSPAAAPVRSFEQCPHVFFETFEEDLGFLLRQLAAVGIEEALRVDLSRPGWPVHVVRAIVPGLEGHIDMGDYRPGPRGVSIMESA